MGVSLERSLWSFHGTPRVTFTLCLLHNLGDEMRKRYDSSSAAITSDQWVSTGDISRPLSSNGARPSQKAVPPPYKGNYHTTLSFSRRKYGVLLQWHVPPRVVAVWWWGLGRGWGGGSYPVSMIAPIHPITPLLPHPVPKGPNTLLAPLWWLLVLMARNQS